MTNCTRYFTMLCLIFTSFYAYSQCAMIELTLEAIEKESKSIVEGEIIASHSFWGKDQKMIYTSYEVLVSRTLKGENNSSLKFIVEGGQVGLKRIDVNPSFICNVGDHGIYLLKPLDKEIFSKRESGVFIPSAYTQSYFKYNYDYGFAANPFKKFSLSRDELVVELESTTGQKSKENFKLVSPTIIQNNDSQESRAITSFTPTTIRAGAKQVLTINGNNFGTQGTVKFLAADYGGTALLSALPAEILTWTASQITVQVPSGAGTGQIRVTPNGGSDQISSGTLTIPGNQTNVISSNIPYQLRHGSQVTGQPKFILSLNSAFASNTAAKDAFARALKTWSCAMGMNWEISSSNTSTATNADDNVNVISFATLSAGTLGITYSYYNGCFIGSNLFWFTTEFDMLFNSALQSGFSWNYSTSNPTSTNYDFETVALHELGHALQLGHIIDNTKVMHYSVSNGQAKRSPSAAEIFEASNVYSRSTSNTNLCGGIIAFTNIPNTFVTNTNASGAGSLAQALTEVCPSDTISFSVPANSTFNISAEMNITKDTKIIGLNQNTFTFSGGNTSRIFNVANNVNLTLENMRLINGFSSTSGGAFLNNGTVTLKNVTFQGNKEGTVNKAFSSAAGKTAIVQGNVTVKP